VADLNERDAKLVQYLGEAHGKEKELETSLQAHIQMTTKAPYKKRLQQHLRETKSHSKQLERRIKALGGTPPKVGTVISKGMAAAKGPLHMARGTGEQEKMLKNAKTEYFSEHEEIATYQAIEVFAEKVGDSETAKLAKGIRREEERMAKFLEGQIKSLTGAVVTEEVPSDQRRKSSSGRRRSAASSRSASKSTRAKASTRAKSTTSRAKKTASRAKTRSKSSASRASSGSASRSKSRRKS